MVGKGKDEREILISSELYDVLHHVYADGAFLLNTGYICYLKKVKNWLLYEGELLGPLQIQEELARLNHFMEKLQKCIRITRFNQFIIGDLFCREVKNNHLVRFKKFASAGDMPPAAVEYEERDNYAVKVLLKSEAGITEYVGFVIEGFIEALNCQSIRLRFLQLATTLEICFNTVALEPVTFTVARYTALLLSGGRVSFQKCYQEVLELFECKNSILTGADGSDNEINQDLKKKTDAMEELVRSTIKALIKINPHSKSQLFDHLNGKPV